MRYDLIALMAAAALTAAAAAGISRLAAALENHPRIPFSTASRMVKEYCGLDAAEALNRAEEMWPGILQELAFLGEILGPPGDWIMPPGALVPEDGMAEDESGEKLLGSPFMPEGTPRLDAAYHKEILRGANPPGHPGPEHATVLDAIVYLVLRGEHLQYANYRNISFQRDLEMNVAGRVYQSDIQLGALDPYEALNELYEYETLIDYGYMSDAVFFGSDVFFFDAVNANCDLVFGTIPPPSAFDFLNASWHRHIEAWPSGNHVFTFTNTAIQGPEPLQMSVWVPIQPGGIISMIQWFLIGWTGLVWALGMAFVWKRARPLVKLARAMAYAGEILRTAANPRDSLRGLTEEIHLSSREPAMQECRMMLDELFSLLQEREDWLANFVHELKNDLLAASAGLEFSRAGGGHAPSGGAEEARSRDIRRTVSRALGKVMSVLNYQRTLCIPDLTKSTDVAAVLTSVVDEIEDSGGEAVFQGDSDLYTAGRMNDLWSAINNLALNAHQHGGAVEITARKDEEGANAEIVIDDHGPGIPENRMKEVFKPYTQMSPDTRHKGAGLGMTIARNVVHSHGGTITLENRKDAEGNVQGLRVRVVLPLSKQKTNTKHECSSPDIAPL